MSHYFYCNSLNVITPASKICKLHQSIKSTNINKLKMFTVKICYITKDGNNENDEWNYPQALLCRCLEINLEN